MTLEAHKRLSERRKVRSVAEGLTAKLNALLIFPESQGSLGEILYRLAVLAAGIFDARDCSIVLFSEELDKSKLQSAPGFGDPASAAHGGAFGNSPGISCSVKAREGLLSTESEKLRHMEDTYKPSMFCPILSHDETIGIIHVSEPKTKRRFNASDLGFLEVVALAIAKLSQVIQLQYILNSRVTQIPLAQSVNGATVHPMQMRVEHRNRVAEIVAKSFYVEMKKAGFGPNEIINAASEILSQLSNNLRKGVEV